MERRDALKALGSLSAGLFVAPSAMAEDFTTTRFGALPPDRPQFEANRRSRSFHQVFAPLKGISTLGKRNVFLWDYLQREIGEIVPHWQGQDPEDGSQGEGDCVGHAAAMAVDLLTATQIHLLGKREKFIAKAAVEPIYWGSRVEIGKDQIGAGGGSRGVWAAKYLKDYGVLHRKEYNDGVNKLDLSGYSPARSRLHKRDGVPDWLEVFARQHGVQEITNVRSGLEFLDAVCAGQPVIMCSSYAFEDTRDDDGFAKAHLGQTYKRGWRWFEYRKKWYHAMCGSGALVQGPRIGGAIQNSHGDWNSGPRPHGLPRGGFFTELNVLDLMTKDWFDCWALSAYKGHEARKIRHRLYRR